MRWVDVSVRPPSVMLDRAHAASDGVVHLVLTNRSDRPVRVRSVRIVWLRGDAVVRTDEPGAAFFRDARERRSARLDRGGMADWGGICLERPPDGADRVRFELELTAGGGTGTARTVESVEAPLRVPEQLPEIRLPVSGLWRVSQGHGCRTNHRLGGYGADFAWDFVAADSRSGGGTADSRAEPRRNRDSASFGRTVAAPVSGRVVRAVDDVPDNEGLRDYPPRTLVDDLAHPLWIFGNHVVIVLPDAKTRVLLAHLKRDSVRVKTGDLVRAGEPIAEVGNSGNTIAPHLHVHVMDRDDPSDPQVVGLPARIADYLEVTSRSNAGRRDSVIRRVASGDPLEGTVVAPAADDGSGRP